MRWLTTSIIFTLLVLCTGLAGATMRIPEDSIAIPGWAFLQDAPEVYVGDEAPARMQVADSSSCELLYDLQLTDNAYAVWFDSLTRTTQLFVGDYPNNQVLRYDIDSLLSLTTTVLPMTYGIPRAAADLDQDGNLDLVLQRGSGRLDIHSAPSWDIRSSDIFGLNVLFYVETVDIDSDPYIEVYAPLSSLGGTAIVVLIQYDPALDSFVVSDQVPAPYHSIGNSAVADFDGDGRFEFITGAYDGYFLYEYDTSLVYIGPVGTQLPGNNQAARVTYPVPDGIPYALLGHSSPEVHFHHELLRAIGDNVFEVYWERQEQTGWLGVHRSGVADVDCDGLDELLLNFYPTFEVWEFDIVSGSFIPGCSWASELYGTLGEFPPVDLDQNGTAEWGTINNNLIFRDFRDVNDPGGCNLDTICICPSQGDLDGSWARDAVDLNESINIIFFNATDVQDPQCPATRSDFNFDGFTDSVDMNDLIEHLFFNGEYPCYPCDPVQSTCAP